MILYTQLGRVKLSRMGCSTSFSSSRHPSFASLRAPLSDPSSAGYIKTDRVPTSDHELAFSQSDGKLVRLHNIVV